jgi:hypothetical protein
VPCESVHNGTSSGVVWCGVVWCGVVWCGAQCCAVQCCAVLCCPPCRAAPCVLCAHLCLQLFSACVAVPQAVHLPQPRVVVRAGVHAVQLQQQEGI